VELARPRRRDALKQSETRLNGIIAPDWFAHESQGLLCLHQRSPTERHFRFAKQFVRQDEKKQVCETVTDEGFEFSSAVQPALQGGEFTENTIVAVMPKS